MDVEVQTRVGELRERLANALAQDEIDFGKVVELAGEMAREDPNNVRFSTDAALISRLGRELVSKQETAVSELIKNAYDADATKVDLVFDDADEPGGVLEVVDDGHGMSRQQLIDGFMRISSTDKVEHPVSPKFHRSRAGKKGIGRFAAQRLGRELEIVTQTVEANHALRVVIDWSQFEGGRDLASIASRIEEVSKQEVHGTTLIIRDLRDAWTLASVQRIYRYIAEILQPFPLSEQDQTREEDPGFRPNVFQRVDDDLELIVDETTEILQHSLATIRGEVNSTGEATWSIVSDRLDLDEQRLSIGRDDDDQPFSSLRDVRFEAHYFIYVKDLIPHGYLGLIRDLGAEQGGVRVYRNGFRVLPYGEKDDDWLRLNETYRRRQILAPIGTNYFFGFVAIDDPLNERFDETSSREGLIENEAFRELRSFLHRVLVSAVLKVSEARGRKQRAGQRDWEGREKTNTERLEDAASRMAEVASRGEKPAEDGGASPTPDEAHDEKQEAEKELQEAVQAIVEEIGMLRILASLGLSIGEFTHEIKASIGGAAADANFIVHTLEDNSGPRERALQLRDSIQSFKSYSTYFDQAVARNVSRELEIQPLDRVVKRFVKVAQSSTDGYGVVFQEPEVDGFDLYTCPMHPSEWPSILFNFYTNAKKAVVKTGRGSGEVFIRVGRKGGRVFLEFQDTGVGIPEEHADRVFDAFYTTTSPAGPDVPDDEALRGSGLGLKIVDDIISSYQGEVFVSTPDTGFSTCIRVELPAATDEEIEEYHG